MINIFDVERTLKLPNGDEFNETGTVAIYSDKVTNNLTIEYKTEKGTLAKLIYTPMQVFQLLKGLSDAYKEGD